MTKQYGFYFDARRCIQCRTCELACKSTRDVAPGVHWRQVVETWSGNYPHVIRSFFSLSCMHCAQPACLAACPVNAITKRPADGLVLVDTGKCNGCRDCLEACPYHVPQFGKDGKMQKCDYCAGAGGPPQCVQACPTDAIAAGLLDDLLKKPKGKLLKKMDGATGPSLIVTTWPE